MMTIPTVETTQLDVVIAAEAKEMMKKQPLLIGVGFSCKFFNTVLIIPVNTFFWAG
jgi:hypothetical protein